jgi:hypothetical protein
VKAELAYIRSLSKKIDRMIKRTMKAGAEQSENNNQDPEDEMPKIFED